MNNSMKLWDFKFWAIIAIVVMLCAMCLSAEVPEDKDQQEVLTGLGQRMLKRVSVDFRNTPIDDVIRIMADQADVDIVKSPKVEGNVTATLTNVPLEEALTNILAAHGYGFVASKNMIRIVPLSEISEGAERLDSRIYRIQYADVSEVEKALKKFISKRGSLSSNPGTSNIIVTDTESKIKAIDTFIEEIDRVTPQILVEARIYDMTTKDRFDLGVQWQAGTKTTFDNGVGINPTAFNRDPFINSGFGSEAAKTEGVTGALRFGWLNENIDIDVLLTARKQDIEAKLLANPRVLVLDNELANIKIIEEIPYQELTETSAGGSIGTTEFREVGVELAVTPHLTRDDVIRLHLVPVFSVQTGEVTLTGTTSSLGGFTQPVVDKRTADTTMLVKNGQTVVLGGLRKRTESKQLDKIPVLGDMPLIGPIFRFRADETVMSELVIFVTPWLIENPVMSESEQQAFEVTQLDGPVQY